MGSRPASKKASPKSIPRPTTATAGGGGLGGGGGAGGRGGGAGGGGSERSDDTRGRRSLRPSPEWNGYAPERPHKKQRTGRSKEDVPEQTGLMRAGWEILRPGLMPQMDVRSFVAPDRVSPQYRPADEDGYYVYELGENISTRYKILARIGEGSFGRVLECWDRKERSFVAIKVIRNIDKYRHAAMIEIEVLNTVQKNDPTGKRHCIALKDWFEYRGHVCMVFDRFGPSLYDFLRRNDYKAFPCFLVQHFGRIILEAVAYLHEIKLVHTDLKPENILLDRDGIQKISEADSAATYGRIDEALKEEQRCKMMKIPSTRRLHIIDFGSATFNDQYHSSLVSTRHYRAPEVVLGLGWSYPCDIWSVGCILTELITGDALFQTHENLEHLAMMEVVVDKPVPSSMVRKSSKTAKKYFNDDGQLIWPTSSTNRKSMRAVYRLRPIKNYLVDFGHRSVWPVLDTLVDLLVRMLEFEPEQRITARQALEHPFFKMTNGAA